MMSVYAKALRKPKMMGGKPMRFTQRKPVGRPVRG